MTMYFSEEKILSPNFIELMNLLVLLDTWKFAKITDDIILVCKIQGAVLVVVVIVW